jgi:diguanylate cyclase (GGDEF)-like protein/PAS domain S-box-containing protein
VDKKIRVLYVEDDVVDQVAFKRFLATEKLPYDFVIAHSKAEALQILTDQVFDVIISDYNLGDGSAIDLLQSPYIHDTPVIVVTGAGDEETAVQLMKKGANDYLIKDENRNYLKMLPTTINQAILGKEREVLISKLHQVVEQSPGMIVLTDLDGDIEYVNNKFLEVTEYQSQDILGKNMSIISPEDKYYEIRESLSKGNAWKDEIASLTKTGNVFWELTTYSPIRNKEGRIVNYMKRSENITLRKKMEQQLEIMANTDVLTGSYSRRAGLLILETQMKQAKRDAAPLTIGFVDVNNLKHINDKFGHAEGDEAIIAVNKSIAKVLRASDTLCRFGGDELLIILPKCNKEQARQMWQRISNNFDFYNRESGKPYTVSASFGFAEYQHDKDIPIDHFIDSADKEMYANKQAFKKADKEYG